MADRPDSPWYPTARLFRVKPPEWLDTHNPTDPAGWRAVLDRVAAALTAIVTG